MKRILRILSVGAICTFFLVPAWGMAQSPLDSNQVRDFIETRMAVARLQNEMKAKAEQYDDVVRAFFERRAELLTSRGWTVEDFDAVKDRVHAARSAMREAAELEEKQADDREMIREMEATGSFSDEQLQEMRQSLGQVDAKREAWIDETRPDWPAVKHWKDELDGMTAWIAGNTDTPPSL